MRLQEVVSFWRLAIPRHLVVELESAYLAVEMWCYPWQKMDDVGLRLSDRL